MPHTYNILPPSLTKYLAEVVGEVDSALSAELGLNIEFRHNGFTALMNELVEVLPTDAKYPLIALIQPFSFEYDGKSDSPKVKFDLMILTDSTPTMTANERETQNYEAILRPIYAELISQISKYQFFSYVGSRPTHRGMDIYHLGDNRGGKNGYIIPDVLDAIIIEGMELQIHSDDRCIGNTQCVDTHAIDLYHNITSFTIAGNGTANLIVGLLDFDFVEYVVTIGDPALEFDNGNGDVVSIELLDPISIDVSGFTDGVYIGRISSDHGGVFTEFEYVVRGGLIFGICKVFANTTFQPLICEDSFEYPLVIQSESECVGVTTIASYDINEESGTVLQSRLYPPGEANISETYTTEITTLLNSYYVNVRTSNGNTITSKIILNLINL